MAGGAEAMDVGGGAWNVLLLPNRCVSVLNHMDQDQRYCGGAQLFYYRSHINGGEALVDVEVQWVDVGGGAT